MDSDSLVIDTEPMEGVKDMSRSKDQYYMQSLEEERECPECEWEMVEHPDVSDASGERWWLCTNDECKREATDKDFAVCTSAIV